MSQQQNTGIILLSYGGQKEAPDPELITRPLDPKSNALTISLE